MINEKGQHGLTRAHVTFLQLYFETGNANQSYRAAYPNHKGSQRTTTEDAYRLLKHPLIAPLIKAARTEAKIHARKIVAEALPEASPMMEPYVAAKNRIANALAKIAFADARDLFEWGPDGVVIKPSDKLTDAQAYAVVEVTQTVTKDGGTIRVKMADKQAALMNLARLQGLLEPGDNPDQPKDAVDEDRRKQVRQKLISALLDLAKPEPLTIEGKAGPTFES